MSMKIKATRAPCSGPADIEAEYRREGMRLLKRLAEPGTIVRRQGETLSIIRFKGKVTMSAGTMPSGVLAPLLSSGAVCCERQGGMSVFIITDAGRAALVREDSGEEAFADQHRNIETREMVVEHQRQQVRVNTREDPLDLLSRQRDRNGAKLIGPAALEAGERLRRDLAQGQAVPKVTANWSRLVVDGGGRSTALSLSEVSLAARQRVDKAMRAVGPDFSGILMDVCGFSKGIETIEQEHALPLRAGKVVLAYALRALARHYGLNEEARGPDRGTMQHWGTDDYRPKMQTG